jgi:hypothetical protein
LNGRVRQKARSIAPGFLLFVAKRRFAVRPELL